MKTLAIGVQTFESIIESDSVYVDKTKVVYQLLEGKSQKRYFFSRPRRFGKSLTCSTFEAIFRGKKELFEGLAISKTDYDWQEYPIIMLDFGDMSYDTPDQLNYSLCLRLRRVAQLYNIDLGDVADPSNLVWALFPQLAEKSKIVFLVDEYDKPILDHIENLPMAHAIRDVLQKFYSSIKSNDRYIQFMFVTGVSKFSQTALFSGFNNLTDLSQHPKAAELVGYTKQEIEHYFAEHLAWAAKSLKCTHDELMNKIARWYDGYQFTKETEFEISPGEKKAIPKIYSPVSVMKFLDRREFSNYWFETGTPTYLVKTIRGRNLDTSWLQHLQDHHVGESVFGSFELDNLPLEALLYQAGYLTIDHYDTVRQTIQLCYPNNEIKISLNSYLLADKIELNENRLRPLIADIEQSLRTADMNLLCRALSLLFANIPYQLHVEQERYYHSLIQMVMMLVGADIQSEVSMATGRIDMVVRTKERIFVLEFKFDKTAQEALDQILEKRYYEKYQHEAKPIILVGLSFNYENKKLTIPCVVQQL